MSCVSIYSINEYSVRWRSFKCGMTVHDLNEWHFHLFHLTTRSPRVYVPSVSISFLCSALVCSSVSTCFVNSKSDWTIADSFRLTLTITNQCVITITNQTKIQMDQFGPRCRASIPLWVDSIPSGWRWPDLEALFVAMFLQNLPYRTVEKWTWMKTQTSKQRRFTRNHILVTKENNLASSGKHWFALAGIFTEILFPLSLWEKSYFCHKSVYI